jgi:hypothetical protein
MDVFRNDPMLAQGTIGAQDALGPVLQVAVAVTTPPETVHVVSVASSAYPPAAEFIAADTPLMDGVMTIDAAPACAAAFICIDWNMPALISTVPTIKVI